MVFSSFRKFISWAFLKLAFGGFVVLSSAGITALWLFNHEAGDYAIARGRYQTALEERRAAAVTAGAAANADLEARQKELAALEDKALRAGKIAAGLEDMQSVWDRFFGNREQWRINQQRIQYLRTLEAQTRKEVKKLASQVTRASRVKERRRAELEAIDTEREVAGWNDSPVFYYLFRAWWMGEGVFLALAALYLVGPTLQKLGLFYHFAPRISTSRPLQISQKITPMPWLSECRPGIEVALWPGDLARVRRRYLQSVEEGLWVKERLFLSWRLPFTSLLSGVVHDVDVRNVRAGRDYSVSFVHHKNPENQMAVVHVPEGGSLVVRPSFLAGVILPPGETLRCKRRWRLFRWQAWLTGQLRFIEFIGPCRLVVAGRPGLRAERLEAREDGTMPSCRTAQDKVIGFTPNLEYRLIRSARFWNYYRWKAMLFDASFTGVGFVLIQTSLTGRRPGLLSNTRQKARRILGL